MRGYLARGILSRDVSDLLRQKAQSLNVTCFDGLIEYIDNCDKWWELLGSGYAKPYHDAGDKRFDEMLSVVEWFASWRADIEKVPGTTKKGRAKMFVSRQTWWALVRGLLSPLRFLCLPSCS